MNLRNNSKGFSLIEISVAMAVIGLLAVVAVPNFQHQVNISKQAEAKANLSALTSGMKTFWAEYAATTARFDVIGFNPEGPLYYGYGFSTDLAPPPNSLGYYGATGTSTCYRSVPIPPAAVGGCPRMTPRWTNNATVNNAFSGTSFNGVRWLAFARAQLIAGGTADEWTIDSGDNLTNTSSGI